MDCEKFSQSTGNQPLVLLGLKGCANGVCTADGVGRSDAYLTGGTVTAVNVVLTVLNVANNALNMARAVATLLVFLHFIIPLKNCICEVR